MHYLYTYNTAMRLRFDNIFKFIFSKKRFIPIIVVLGIISAACDPLSYSDVLDGPDGKGLSLTPEEAQIVCSGSLDLEITGGAPPYTLTIIDPLDGSGESLEDKRYTAPSDRTGTVTIQAEDSYGSTSKSLITVITAEEAAPLTLSPSTISIYTGHSLTLEASGGTAPYIYSLETAIGAAGESFSGSSYTAPDSTGGSAVIRVTDGDMNTADATITVNPATGTAHLTLSPSAITIYTGHSVTLEASGGTAPYSYTLETSIGADGEALTGSSYIAPDDTGGTAVLRVTDGDMNMAETTITVNTGTAPTHVDYGSVSIFTPSNSDTATDFTCEFQFANSGTENGTKTVTWTAYLSDDDTYGIGDSILAMGTTAAVNFGYPSSNIEFSGRWPPPEKTHYLLVVISSDDESDSSDNTGSRAVTVTDP